jgi:hypothetical protein
MVPGAQDKDLNRKSAAFGVHGGELENGQDPRRARLVKFVSTSNQPAAREKSSDVGDGEFDSG